MLQAMLAFAEEREVRLTTILNGAQMRADHEEDGTNWRERERHGDKPRIHLFEGLGLSLPIKRVIVGPGPHQPAGEAEIRALLEELKLDIPVVLSNIPLRTLPIPQEPIEDLGTKGNRCIS